MSVFNTITGETVSIENTEKIIDIYSNQKKSDWIEIPSNYLPNGISPFHFILEHDDLVQCLTIIEQIINNIFIVNNLSAIILQETRKRNKLYRVIYPELLLTYNNEQRLITTIMQYVPISVDKDTQLPNSTKYKYVGTFNNGVINDEDSLQLVSLNGIFFSAILNKINMIKFKQESTLKI